MLSSAQRVTNMMEWEQGNLSPEGEAAFFQDLVSSGVVWGLQGMYGRRAEELILSGVIQNRSCGYEPKGA